MMYSPYSFSRMDSFETCPRKFKYKYIDIERGVDTALVEDDQLVITMTIFPTTGKLSTSQITKGLSTYM